VPYFIKHISKILLAQQDPCEDFSKRMEACAKVLEWMKSSITCLPIVIVIEKME
jgi:hypothetical protein